MYQSNMFGEPVFTGRVRRARPKAEGVQGTLPGAFRAECPICGEVTWWHRRPDDRVTAYTCEGCGGWIGAEIIKLMEGG